MVPLPPRNFLVWPKPQIGTATVIDGFSRAHSQELINVKRCPQYETDDTFLGRLRRGYPPVPGQVTSLLLALKVLYDNLKTATEIDKELAQALFLVAYDSRNLFESGRAAKGILAAVTR